MTPHKNMLFIVGIAILISSCVSYAQDATSILANTDLYYSGTGAGETESVARQNAMASLAQSIVVYVRSNTNNYQSEIGSHIDNRYTSEGHSSSQMRFEGLKFITLPKENGQFKILAYIAKSDFQTSIQHLQSNLTAFLNLVEQDEEERRLHNVIDEYYVAYLRTFHIPYPTSYKSLLSGEDVKDVRQWLERKIVRFLERVVVLMDEPFVEKEEPFSMKIPIHVKYNNVAVNKLTARFDVSGNPVRSIKYGKADLFMFSKPMDRKANMTIELGIGLPEKTNIEELQDIHRLRALVVKKEEMEVDYSKIIRLEFTVHPKNDGYLYFEPKIENLNHGSYHWDFGDGETSNQEKPFHKYTQKKEYRVALCINNSKDLVLTKKILSSEVLNDTTANARMQGDTVTPTLVAAAEKTKPLQQHDVDSVLALEHEKGDTVKFVLQGGREVSVIIPEPESDSVQISKRLMPLELYSLSQHTSFHQLSRELKKSRQEGRIVFGTSKAFIRPANCYILIIDKKSETLIAVLDKGETDRYDFLSRALIKNFKTYFANTSPIFVQVKE